MYISNVYVYIELALRRDERLIQLLSKFETKQTDDAAFLQSIHECIEQESEVIYNDIFHDTSTDVGKHLSREERNQNGWHEVKSLIYGEVEYHSFYQVLRKINPNALTTTKLENGQEVVCTKNAAAAVDPDCKAKPNPLVFYDLGSGTGKAVLLARILYDFSVCKGIEILDGLYNQSKTIERRFINYKKILAAGQSQDVNMVHGSILDSVKQPVAMEWWRDGDIVFANSTCFDDDLMLEMAKLAAKMKPGAFFVTFTKGLSNCAPMLEANEEDYVGRTDGYAFELLDKKRYKMSWGPATVFIHRKLYGMDLGGGIVNDGFNLSVLPCDSAEYEDRSGSDDSDSDGTEDTASLDTDIKEYHEHKQTLYGLGVDRLMRNNNQRNNGSNGDANMNDADEDSDSDSDYCPSDQSDVETSESDTGSDGDSDEEQIFNNYDEMQSYYAQLQKEELDEKQRDDHEQPYVDTAKDKRTSNTYESESASDSESNYHTNTDYDSDEDLDDDAYIQKMFELHKMNQSNLDEKKKMHMQHTVPPPPPQRASSMESEDSTSVHARNMHLPPPITISKHDSPTKNSNTNSNSTNNTPNSAYSNYSTIGSPQDAALLKRKQVISTQHKSNAMENANNSGFNNNTYGSVNFKSP